MNFKLIMIVAIFSAPCMANRVEATGKITRLYSYSEQMGFDGDIAIVTSNPVAGCEGGYWLRKASTEGYKNTLSFLLSAFHAGTNVQFGALSNELWPGSSAKFCRIDQISLIK
jgi:hypothetical protein